MSGYAAALIAGSTHSVSSGVEPAQLLELGARLPHLAAGMLEHRGLDGPAGLVRRRRAPGAERSQVLDAEVQAELLPALAHRRVLERLGRLWLAAGEHEAARAALAHREHPTCSVTEENGTDGDRVVSIRTGHGCNLPAHRAWRSDPYGGRAT
jgi:hypothetical protein